MRISRSLIIFLSAAALWAQPARRPLKLDDLARLREVRDPQCSPDGQWVAYTVSTIDAKEDKSTGHVWMISYDGKFAPGGLLYFELKGGASSVEERVAASDRFVDFIWITHAPERNLRGHLRGELLDGVLIHEGAISLRENHSGTDRVHADLPTL